MKIPAAVIPAALAGAGLSSIAWAQGNELHVFLSCVVAVFGIAATLALAVE